jgi:hypothetical protein
MNLEMNLKLARVYFVLLALVVALRFLLLNVRGLPYEKFTDKVSVVIITLISSLLYAAFARAFLGYRIVDAAKLTMTLGLVSQLVVFSATALSYLVGIQSAFNHPLALNQPNVASVPFGAAMGIRAGGIVVNTLATGIAGAIGWALGGLLPTQKS